MANLVLKQAKSVKTELGGKNRKVVITVITVITVTTQLPCGFQRFIYWKIAFFPFLLLQFSQFFTPQAISVLTPMKSVLVALNEQPEIEQCM